MACKIEWIKVTLPAKEKARAFQAESLHLICSNKGSKAERGGVSTQYTPQVT